MSGSHHADSTPDTGRVLLIGIALNLCFVVVEGVFGVLAHSTALLADAAHNLSDVLGLVLAWGAAGLARRPPSTRHTYGFRRSTVLAALANAVILLTAVGAVAWEAVGRLQTPTVPNGATIVWVAAIGVVINSGSALLLWKGSKHDMNARGAFVHLAADAAVSVGVVGGGALVWQTRLPWIDPVTSLLVSGLVVFATWKLLRDALHLALDGVPKGIDLDAVRSFLLTLSTVESVHDLHVWAISTTESALTAHLRMHWGAAPPAFLGTLEHDLNERFGIAHVTVQIDPVGAARCTLEDTETP